MPHKDPEARKAYLKEYNAKNRDRLLAKAKAYREANPEKVAEAKKRCYERVKDDPEYRARRSEYNRLRRERNYSHVKAIERRSRVKHRDALQERQVARYDDVETKARGAVNRAVRAGKLPKVSELNCRDCGKQAENYHHDSYDEDKWLDVVPLCVMCHKAVHAISDPSPHEDACPQEPHQTQDQEPQK